jgi:hypothetical protein
MTIFINHLLYVDYSLSPKYGTGVLQTLPLKLLTSSLRSRHAVLQYHMTWHYSVTLIPLLTTQEKVLAYLRYHKKKKYWTSQFKTFLKFLIKISFT